ncbi:alpha/beta hydrolase [Coccidioides immitis RS]|uniref:Alpha/beta hydrolase n=1 Tax=Coccidioides immitis (strain RS) TaxID=246410 RepID=J3K8J6_COCIM|nr:alpha/beta hydrolase [Coccidioides immitis RS]EAS31149.3 alpha/beta hydrolase [Coccidioides immitis RS]
MFSFFSSRFFDFELIRILGSTPFGGCDVAEFLEAVDKIKKHDAESWYRAWYEQGERAEKIAQEATRDGHKAPARRAYLRACNYFRASSYMLPTSDERNLPSAERSIRNFRKAIPLMDETIVVLDIPYEDGLTLPGYLYLPAPLKRIPGQKTPILLNCGGADSTQEELYFLYGAAGTDLGYAVLTFEGPGQGLVLKKDQIPMRPDYEAVTSKVLDHLSSIAKANPDYFLDLENIAVAGASMGAYYSLRASTDSRIRACVAVDPFYSLWSLALTRMPSLYANLWQAGWIPESFFNWSVRLSMAFDFCSRWESSLGSYMMGTSTPGQTLRRFQAFTLDDPVNGGKVTDRAKCPILLTGAGHAIYASPDSSTVYIYNSLKHLEKTQKEVWIPIEIGDGGLTAKVGAWGLLAQKSFQFLDKHLGVRRAGLSSYRLEVEV